VSESPLPSHALAQPGRARSEIRCLIRCFACSARNPEVCAGREGGRSLRGSLQGVVSAIDLTPLIISGFDSAVCSARSMWSFWVVDEQLILFGAMRSGICLELHQFGSVGALCHGRLRERSSLVYLFRIWVACLLDMISA
jgi:hypothetical protein